MWKSQAPKKFAIVGSNDCQDWSILLSVEDADFTHENEAKAWIIPCEMRRICACYGIKIFTAKGGTKGFVTIQNVLMWMQIAP